jgi:hypothetical protein
VKGAVNDLGNVIRRPQTNQEDRRGGGAYRYTHGRSERPGVCGARFRRHAEYAGCALRAAASGSTHRFTTAATTAGPTAGESTAARGLLALRWHWQLLSVRRRRRAIYGVSVSYIALRVERVVVALRGAAAVGVDGVLCGCAIHTWCGVTRIAHAGCGQFREDGVERRPRECAAMLRRE